MVRHAQAVRRLDPAALWSSINGNHLPPASASLVHPHLQSPHDAYGLTSQRFLVERSGEWKDGHGSYWAASTDTRLCSRCSAGRLRSPSIAAMSGAKPPGPVTASAEPVRLALEAILPHQPEHLWRPTRPYMLPD